MIKQLVIILLLIVAAVVSSNRPLRFDNEITLQAYLTREARQIGAFALENNIRPHSAMLQAKAGRAERQL